MTRTEVLTAGGDFRRVTATAEELEEWRVKHARRVHGGWSGLRPSVYRVECLECGARIWGSGMGIGSHRRKHRRERDEHYATFYASDPHAPDWRVNPRPRADERVKPYIQQWCTLVYSNLTEHELVAVEAMPRHESPDGFRFTTRSGFELFLNLDYVRACAPRVVT